MRFDVRTSGDYRLLGTAELDHKYAHAQRLIIPRWIDDKGWCQETFEIVNLEESHTLITDMDLETLRRWEPFTPTDIPA